MTEQTQNAELAAVLMSLTQEVQALRSEVAELRRAKAKTTELMDEVGPIGLEVMAAAQETLGELEQKGYFNFGRELIGVLDHVVAGYTADDVRELGENVVTILDTVRTITQPGVMAFAQQAGEAVESGEDSGPVSIWDMMKSRNDPDVQHGLAVVLAVIKQIGRTSRGYAPARRDDTPSHPKYAMMANRLAASRSMKPRLALPAPQTNVNAPKPAPSAVNVEALQRGPLPAPFDSLPTDADGHLANAGDWSREYAQAVANQAGVGELTEEHFVVLEFARASFLEKGASPNVRALATGSGLGTKAIYTLFPKKPGPTIARIAGIPRPVGCI